MAGMRAAGKHHVRMPPTPLSTSTSDASSDNAPPARLRRPARARVRMPAHAPRVLHTRTHTIYVARIDHLHYTPPAPSTPERPASPTATPSPVEIDPATLGWKDWACHQARVYAWVWETALAILIFVASRVSLGFGVRIGGRDP